MKHCLKCGTIPEYKDIFCSHCGARIPVTEFVSPKRSSSWETVIGDIFYGCIGSPIITFGLSFVLMGVIVGLIKIGQGEYLYGPIGMCWGAVIGGIITRIGMWLFLKISSEKVKQGFYVVIFIGIIIGTIWMTPSYLAKVNLFY